MLINYPYRKYRKNGFYVKCRIKYAQSANHAEMGKKAAVINGDGTGPELVDAVVQVLKACNTQIELIRCEAGSEQWEKNGGATYIPDATSKIMDESDACYKGPTTTIPNPNAPRSVAVSTRQKFELYANVRPIKTYDRLSPDTKLDFVCFREATEGLYAGIEFNTSEDSAIAIRKITRKGCKRIVDSAFDWAKKYGLKKVTAITKRNILKRTDGIFWSEVERAAQENPGIEIEEYYIDNMTQQLVKNPERFNNSVLLSTNLFMDIISECASGSIGSIGNVYSANIGSDQLTVVDAGDVLRTVLDTHVDVVLCGHKHRPWAWNFGKLTVVNAGTATSERQRGLFENTYNILTISNKKVQIDLKIVGGKRYSIDEIVNNYSQFDDE